MNVKITPSVLSGEVVAPSSKSYAHRVIICACLSGVKTTVKNIGKSKDVYATVNCMKALGADCEITEGDLKIKGFSLKNSAVLDCGESGSTLRFLMPIAAALGVKTEIKGSAKLLSRPSAPLISALNLMGAQIENNKNNGKLQEGVYYLDASVSSQYVSGLLMAFPLIGGNNKLVLTDKKVSAKYIDITIDVLKIFGVTVTELPNGYEVSGKYTFVNSCVIEGDYSGAAFVLSAGAIGGKVTVNGLNLNTKQGDAEILSVLKKFGADVVKGKNSVTVCAKHLRAISLDCEDIPDIVQIISVVAAYSDGVTVLKNISRLKYKESDRINAVITTLKAANIKAEYSGNDLFIYGGTPKGGVFNSGNDHRTAMACAVLATYADGDSVIENAEAVEKSYPDFFADYVKLGGKLNVSI